MDNFKNYVKNLSNTSIHFFAIVSSTLVGYRYMSNTYLYSEFRGHFNSPQNLQNMKMRRFHYRDTLVSIIFTYSFVYMSFKLAKNYLNERKEKDKYSIKGRNWIIMYYINDL